MRFFLPLLALAAVAAPAVAETVTLRIAYGDVDVTTTEGRAALEARIDASLRKACTLEGNARYSHGHPVIDSKCVAEARTSALAEVERVAALQASNGRKVAAN